MVSGIALGGVAQGIDQATKRLQADDQLAINEKIGNARIAQGDRRLDLMNQRLGLDRQIAKSAEEKDRIVKLNGALGNTMSTISNIVTNGLKSGADMGRIRKAIAPLLSDINDLAPAAGRDPAQLLRSIEASIAGGEASADGARATAKGGKPLTESGSARLTAIATARTQFDDLVKRVQNFGEIGTFKNLRANAEWQIGRGEPYKAYIAGTLTIEALLRALTGAVAPDKEFARISRTFMPTPYDMPETRQMKLTMLNQFMKEATDAMQAGRIELIPKDKALQFFNSAETRIKQMTGVDVRRQTQLTEPQGEKAKGSANISSFIQSARAKLAQGVDRQAVIAIMQRNGIDPSLIDEDPVDQISPLSDVVREGTSDEALTNDLVRRHSG